MSNTDKLAAKHAAIRKVLQHHGLTKHGDCVVEADLIHALEANEEEAATSSDVDDAEYRLTDAIWVYGEACIHGDSSDIANKTERVECLIGELIAVAVANAAPGAVPPSAPCATCNGMGHLDGLGTVCVKCSGEGERVHGIGVKLDEDAIRADERERCAKACEAVADHYQASESMMWPELKTDAQSGANECAEAIRGIGAREEA